MAGLHRRRARGNEPPASPSDVWVRAVQRLERAVNRYVEQIATLRDRRLRAELQHIGLDLDLAVHDFHAAGQAWPAVGAGQDERALAAVHRAATLCIHAVDAAMTAQEASRRYDLDGVSAAVDATRLLVKAIRELSDAWRPDRE